MTCAASIFQSIRFSMSFLLKFTTPLQERKGQNMFRPLLSSVPSSTFYVGKTNAHSRPLTSRNSSMTTSSNASSDQGTTAAIDTEESEQNHYDEISDSFKGRYPTVRDEVFVMDQPDATNESVENIIIEESPGSQHHENDEPSTVNSKLSVAKYYSHIETTTPPGTDGVILDGKIDSLDADITPDVEVCSKCYRSFHFSDLVMEGELWVCQECKSLDENSPEKNTTSSFVQTSEDGELKDFTPSTATRESSQAAYTGDTTPPSCCDSVKDLTVPAIEEQHEINHSMDGGSDYQQSMQSGNYTNSKLDGSEGTGISLVLKRSISGKGHLVQSRSFTASNTSYEDFSYVRDSLNSLRSSIGRSSASVSSSVDLGSSRQTETRIHRQLSMETYRHEMPPRHKRSISSLSGASGHTSQVPSMAPSYLEDTTEAVSANNFKETVIMMGPDPHDGTLNECIDTESTLTDVGSNIILKDGQPEDGVKVSNLTAEEPASCENSDNLGATQKDEAAPSSCANMVDVVEVPYPSSLDAISEMEIENADTVSVDIQSDVDSPNSKCVTELAEPSSVPEAHEDDTTAADTFPANGILGMFMLHSKYQKSYLIICG